MARRVHLRYVLTAASLVIWQETTSSPKARMSTLTRTNKKTIGYANSAEMFDYQLEQDWYDPYYSYWGNGSWYLDSGASSHIIVDPDKLDHLPTSSGVEISEIKTGGGESHPVQGTGTATVQTNNGAIKLKSVKYVPSMKKNLISRGNSRHRS